MASITMDQAAAILTPRIGSLAQRAAWVAVVSFGYYGLAAVGTVLRVPPSGFSIVWPANAFLVGVLLLTPVRQWWTYLIGLIPTHLGLVASIDTRHPDLLVAATQIFGNVLVVVATAVAVQRASKGPVRFDSFRGTLVFILVAALAVPAVASALVICIHMLTGWATDFWLSWRQWMLASLFPAITITPLMILTAGGHVIGRDIQRPGIEVPILSAILFLVIYLTFGKVTVTAYEPMLLLAPLPILLWAAARWQVWGVCLSLLVTASAIILRALAGTGPFATSAAPISIVSLQVYLSVIAIPLLLLAALMQELWQDKEKLKRSEARIDVVAASTETGLWQWDGASGLLWMTEHCRKMFGLCPEADHAPSAFLNAVHPEDRARVRAALEQAMKSVDVQVLSEFRVRGPTGEGERWIVMRTGAESDADRGLVRVSGVFRDVTLRKLAQLKSDQLSNRLLTLQDDERKNIAQALHDSTTQHLVAVGLMTGMLERRMTLTEETQSLLEDMRGSLAKAIKELRTFTYLLRPPELEQQGLCDLLEKYVRGFGLRTGMRVLAKVSPEADALPIERRRALFRIAQESLANVHRHAEARRVSLNLRRYGDELHMIIRDNGRGMCAASPHGEPVRLGVGIPGMTARIREMGGRIDIRSGVKGTTVHVALPVEADEESPRPAYGSPALEAGRAIAS